MLARISAFPSMNAACAPDPGGDRQLCEAHRDQRSLAVCKSAALHTPIIGSVVSRTETGETVGPDERIQTKNREIVHCALHNQDTELCSCAFEPRAFSR